MFLLIRLATSVSLFALPDPDPTLLAWNKDPTPGVELKIVQSTFPFHALKVTGAPTDKSYRVYVKHLGRPPTSLPEEFQIGSEGMLIARIRELDVPFRTILGNFARGEPLEYAVVSSDESVRAFAEIVPFPLHEANSVGYQVTMTMLDPGWPGRGYGYAVLLEGFSPGDEVKLKATGGRFRDGAGREFSATIGMGSWVPKNGDKSLLTAWIAPDLGRTKGGDESLTVTGAKGDVTIRFSWGTNVKTIQLPTKEQW